jgi:tryptophanyl-tRNA synthetase
MGKIFSGIQPTGKIHLGNYLGALKNWIELQDKHECIFCIVNYHALTVPYDPSEMQDNIYNTAVDLLALGINPDKCILFVQSHVPEHTELAWIFNTLTPISELKRMTQFKEKSEKFNDNINVGLFDYPVLQAADILLYMANMVPVGKDQVQHVELTRDIARRFNKKYQKYFPEPKPLLTNTPKIMSLKDPTKKMSKSLGDDHYIALSDSPDVITSKIKKAVTDIGDNKTNISPGVENLFTLLEIFATQDLVQKFQADQKNGSIKYSELKDELSKAIIQYLLPFQQKRKKMLEW